MQYYTLYKTTNKTNGKYYYGIHGVKSLEGKHVNDRYLGSGVAVIEAILNEGRENFEKEVLCMGDFAYISNLEIAIVNKKLIENENCYNLRTGGSANQEISEETRKLMSISGKGKRMGAANPFYGKQHTNETKAIFSENGKLLVGEKNGFYGKHHTYETKATLSENGKLWIGEKNGFYGKQHTNETKATLSEKARLKTGEKNPFYGKQHTDETKAKISKANKGRVMSDEEKANRAITTLRGKDHPLYGKYGENNPNYGKIRSNETKAKISKAQKGKKQKIIICTHCNKSGGISNMKRWHFDNCKHNPKNQDK